MMGYFEHGNVLSRSIKAETSCETISFSIKIMHHGINYLLLSFSIRFGDMSVTLDFYFLLKSSYFFFE